MNIQDLIKGEEAIRYDPKLDSKEQLRQYKNIETYMIGIEVQISKLLDEGYSDKVANVFFTLLDMMRSENRLGKRLANNYLHGYVRITQNPY